MDKEKRKEDLKSIINAAISLIVALSIFGLSQIVVSQMVNNSPTEMLLSITSRILLVAAIPWVVGNIMIIGLRIASNKEIPEPNKEKYINSSIVSIMRQKRWSNDIYIQLGFTASSWILYYIGVNVFASFILLLLVLISAFRAGLFEFRLKKGFYGTNEYETREIIQFILENSKDIDFTDGSGKTKKIISVEDLEQIKMQAEQSLHGLPEAI